MFKRIVIEKRVMEIRFYHKFVLSILVKTCAEDEKFILDYMEKNEARK
jgi:hypothetical protein